MNQAHLHLMLAHLPIIIIPVGLLILILGLIKNNSSYKSVALYLFVFSALAAIPVFLLGEGAEELIEMTNKVPESLVQDHEEVSIIALWLSILLGVCSLTLMLFNKLFVKSYAQVALIVVALLTSAVLALAANKGGRIGHPEVYSAEAGSSLFNNKENDDD